MQADWHELWKAYETPVLWTLAGLLLFLLLSRLFFPRVRRLAQRWNRPFLSVIFEAFQMPVSYFVLLCCVVTALPQLPFPLFQQESYRSVQSNVASILSILLFAWGFWRCTSLVPSMVQKVRGRFDLDTSKALTTFLRRVVQVLIVFLSGVMILSSLDYNVNALVAGLGIGGLTIALAAQDAASNFFGGFTLIAEHPFEIGDWVEVLGVEGTVEDITLRSTKIRTLENSLTTLPNSKLCNAPITNFTNLHKRLLRFTIGVTYDTPREVLEHLLTDFRALLESDPEICQDSIQVNLADFSESSIDIFFQFYAATADIAVARAIRSRLDLSILQLMEKNGAAFAFPTRSVYLEAPLPKE